MKRRLYIDVTKSAISCLYSGINVVIDGEKVKESINSLMWMV